MTVNTNLIKYSIVILAAGHGTRMKTNISKVLHKVSGITMLEYVVNTAKSLSQETSEIAVVSRKDLEEVNRIAGEHNVKLAIQEQQIGTANAAQTGIKAINLNSDVVVVLYADTPLIKADTIANASHNLLNDTSAALSVFGFRCNNNNEYARIIKVDHFANQIIEFKDATDEERQIDIYNSGIMIIKTKYIKDLLSKVNNNNAKNEYYLTDLVKIAKESNLHSLLEICDFNEFKGVNNLVELADINKTSQLDIINRHLLNGVIITNPEQTYINYDAIIGSGTVIEPFCYIGPKVKIGSGVHIKSFSHIEGTEIHDQAIIGPYARLRPGTNILENAHIGSFVEVKNSKICQNAKANHLSYIGDAEIGEKTNIGAGTIFCNYDGFNKYKSKVGQNVFIGSNTSIVSPVNIDDGSIIAAGSVVTKNVEKDTLVISRPEEKHLVGKAKVIKSKKSKNGGH